MSIVKNKVCIIVSRDKSITLMKSGVVQLCQVIILQ